MKKIIYIFIVFIGFGSIIYAHQGRTDGYGGHYNRSTGTYHYHSGPYANTGEYTKPIQEGGTKIDTSISNSTIVDKDVELKEVTLDDDIEELQIELNNKEEEISSLNRELEEQKIEYEEELEEKESEIEDLEDEKTTILINCGIIYLISIYIAYKIGESKK